MDIIEIKRPSHDFWSATKDHDNYIPSMVLVKSITQSNNYIYEIEREMDSNKFRERINDNIVIKPRCTLIIGRSHEWNQGQQKAYRLLNASYYNLQIITYDHVLERAKRMCGLNG